MSSSGLLAALRQRTAPLHQRLDSALSDAVPPTRAGYVAFLRATLAVQRRVLPAIARWIARPDDARRLACLQADLAGLDAAPRDDDAPPLVLPDSLGGAYGVAYVVEGSTLGGLVLADRFEAALGLPSDVATRYLRLRGRDTAGGWRAFLADLEGVANALPEPQREDACVAAVAAFEAYRAAFVAHGVIRDV